MNRRLVARIACTALLSPLLMILSHELYGKGFRWLSIPFWAPGVFVVTRLLPQGIYAAHRALYMQAAVLLNFVFIWIALMFLSGWLEKSFTRKREQE